MKYTMVLLLRCPSVVSVSNYHLPPSFPLLSPSSPLLSLLSPSLPSSLPYSLLYSHPYSLPYSLPYSPPFSLSPSGLIDLTGATIRDNGAGYGKHGTYSLRAFLYIIIVYYDIL